MDNGYWDEDLEEEARELRADVKRQSEAIHRLTLTSDKVVSFIRGEERVMGFCDRHVDSPRHKPLPTECAFCSNGQVLRRDQAVFSVLTGLREAMGMPTYPEMDRVRKFEAGQDVWVRGDDGRPYLVQDANATAARLVWHDSKKGGGFTRLD